MTLQGVLNQGCVREACVSPCIIGGWDGVLGFRKQNTVVVESYYDYIRHGIDASDP